MKRFFNPLTIGLTSGILLAILSIIVFPQGTIFDKPRKEEKQGRMHVVDHLRNPSGPDLYICRVDGREYLVTQQGGVIPLDSKP